MLSASSAVRILNSDNATVTMPTPYPELNDLLAEMVGQMQTILRESFIGAYLQGSFAVGDFDRHSDVDFIVAVENELSDEQVAALQIMHDRIYGLEVGWAQHLEGSYFPKDILRDTIRRGSDLWFLDHGSRSLVRSDHCNTLVVRWVMHEHGIALAGPPAPTLVDSIPADELRTEILKALTGWGQQILDDPALYENNFYQGFIVLSYCRMLRDYVVGQVGSKRTGAEWAKDNLDPAWSGLIDRAWDTRPDPARSFRQPADPDDFAATLDFVRYVIGESQRYAQED